MEIHCGNCREELDNEDIIIMNWINTLTHFTCYEQDTDLIKDIGSYGVIKNKYPFYTDSLK